MNDKFLETKIVHCAHVEYVCHWLVINDFRNEGKCSCVHP